jgi:citrate lyase subunit beta/citryl-CoA lyase
MQERPLRARRTCHAVPGTSERFLAKAPSLGADEVFLDLEDAAAADQKELARANVIEAQKTLDFAGTTVVVRVRPASVSTRSCCRRSVRLATSR